MAGTSPAMTKSIAPPLTSAVFPPISPSPGPSGLSAFGGGGDRDDTIERGAGRAPAATPVSLLAPRHARDGPDHGRFADANIGALADAELDAFERLTDVPEPEL